jgi:hypothetical protein
LTNFKIDEDGLMEFSDTKVVGYAKVEMPLTEEDIENIIVTAIEGGINYWGHIKRRVIDWTDKPKNVPPSQWATKLLLEGKSVTIVECDEDSDEVVNHELTLEKVIQGFAKNYKERPWDNNIETGDADTASCIIQYAIFDDVVYG